MKWCGLTAPLSPATDPPNPQLDAGGWQQGLASAASAMEAAAAAGGTVRATLLVTCPPAAAAAAAGSGAGGGAAAWGQASAPYPELQVRNGIRCSTLRWHWQRHWG